MTGITRGGIEPYGFSPNPPPQPVRGYSYGDVALALQVSISTVKVWVRLGRIPSPTYEGVRAFWTGETLETIRRSCPRPAGTFIRNPSPRALTAASVKNKILKQKRALKRGAK